VAATPAACYRRRVASELPRLLITGASGFLGRTLVESLKDEVRLFCFARRSQRACGIAEHPNISWLQADIGEYPQLAALFREVQDAGGTDTVVHLAAYYDFTGEEIEEYERTNVKGLRHVLELCADHGVRRFVFASSVAACAFPPPWGALSEESPPDGDHIYARTKRAGEEMLAEFEGHFHSVVVRFAAMFSDWCEYAPLFMFLQTWLGRAWNRSVLGGRGESAIPYLHVEDAALLVRRVLDRFDQLLPGEVLIASPDGAVSHRQLHEAATLACFGHRHRPLLVPKWLALPGMHVLDLLGRLTGERPFERPWMARYIDLAMRVDASRTRDRLGWAPRPRLEMLRRIPFLVDNLKTYPLEWHRRNQAALKTLDVPVNLKIHWLLEKHHAEIIREFNALLTGAEGQRRFKSYQQVSAEEHAWHHQLVLRQLMNAVRTRERALFRAYCRDLAQRRFVQGFGAAEVCGVLELLNLVCFRVLRRDPEAKELRQAILDYVTTTLRFGCDEAQEVFELMQAGRLRPQPERSEPPSAAQPLKAPDAG
jgi:nucleoside-diphosphate-sugar epimerase